MTDLLSDALVVLYFQPDPTEHRANADLVVRGQQDGVEAGDRVLVYDGMTVTETVSTTAIASGYHPMTLRLPDKYQTDEVKVTCPDCKFTYTHQHIFAEGTK